MSVVVLRVRNTGGFDIAPEDFEIPLSFTFGSRIVWDARVSDATDDGPVRRRGHHGPRDRRRHRRARISRRRPSR
ncbi:MAG: phosphate transport system substrate-binding protein [Actinomycetota bacterium]|nr:phosphate transport system substrate-binding protein [Actinomycetota bacterium]